MRIPDSLIQKYHIGCDPDLCSERDIYTTFLIQTDYICNKIVEGVATKEDYPEELEYRQIAREEIDRILTEEAASETQSSEQDV